MIYYRLICEMIGAIVVPAVCGISIGALTDYMRSLPSPYNFISIFLAVTAIVSVSATIWLITKQRKMLCK